MNTISDGLLLRLDIHTLLGEVAGPSDLSSGQTSTVSLSPRLRVSVCCELMQDLRQTLVAALPERDEEMIRLEAFLAALLDSQQDAERRQLLHRYLIWHLIRRLRSRNNGSPATRQQSLMIRRLARGAIAFLDWLDAHDLTLNSCQ